MPCPDRIAAIAACSAAGIDRSKTASVPAIPRGWPFFRRPTRFLVFRGWRLAPWRWCGHRGGSSGVPQAEKALFDRPDFLREVRQEASHISSRDAPVRDEPFHDPLRLSWGYRDYGSLFHGHSFTRGQWYIGVPVAPAVLRGSDAEFFCGSRAAWARTAT